ncbi:MAG: hypothetical protein ACLRS8_18265 [Parabacteroides merdae]
MLISYQTPKGFAAATYLFVYNGTSERRRRWANLAEGGLPKLLLSTERQKDELERRRCRDGASASSKKHREPCVTP